MADNKVTFEVVATAKGVNQVQKQTDKLAKSTDGADKSTQRLDKSRNTYNRREKGAAGISSNSTKNFSKMAQSVDGGGGSGGPHERARDGSDARWPDISMSWGGSAKISLIMECTHG